MAGNILDLRSCHVQVWRYFNPGEHLLNESTTARKVCARHVEQPEDSRFVLCSVSSFLSAPRSVNVLKYNSKSHANDGEQSSAEGRRLRPQRCIYGDTILQEPLSLVHFGARSRSVRCFHQLVAVAAEILRLYLRTSATVKIFLRGPRFVTHTSLSPSAVATVRVDPVTHFPVL